MICLKNWTGSTNKSNRAGWASSETRSGKQERLDQLWFHACFLPVFWPGNRTAWASRDFLAVLIRRRGTGWTISHPFCLARKQDGSDELRFFIPSFFCVRKRFPQSSTGEKSHLGQKTWSSKSDHVQPSCFAGKSGRVRKRARVGEGANLCKKKTQHPGSVGSVAASQPLRASPASPASPAFAPRSEPAFPEPVLMGRARALIHRPPTQPTHPTHAHPLTPPTRPPPAHTQPCTHPSIHPSSQPSIHSARRTCERAERSNLPF